MNHSDDNFARSIHLTGRQVEIRGDSFPDDYIVVDADGILLGIYPRDFVSAILPIITTGPGEQNAGNISEPAPDPKKTKKRDPSRLS
jgi:hypothetical protein